MGWKTKGWAYKYPGSHSQVTHYGVRVAPQRCPILRVSIERIADAVKLLK